MTTTHHQTTADAVRLRASDADRQAAAAVLEDATARGLLSHDEGGERMAAAWDARFRDELPPLTADLPPAPAPPSPTSGWRHAGSVLVAQTRTTTGELLAGGWRGRRLAVLLAVLLVLGLLAGVAVGHLAAGGGHAGGFGPHR